MAKSTMIRISNECSAELDATVALIRDKLCLPVTKRQIVEAAVLARLGQIQKALAGVGNQGGAAAKAADLFKQIMG